MNGQPSRYVCVDSGVEKERMRERETERERERERYSKEI